VLQITSDWGYNLDKQKTIQNKFLQLFYNLNTTINNQQNKKNNVKKSEIITLLDWKDKGR